MNVIHRAGRWINHQQRCTECALLLADINALTGASLTGKAGPYPEGALIEEAKMYWAVHLTASGPTCLLGRRSAEGAGKTPPPRDVAS